MSECKVALVGEWQLVSSCVTDAAGNPLQIEQPKKSGVLVYFPNGHMAAQIGTVNRPKSTEILGNEPEADLASAYRGYMAYFGTYRIDSVRSVIAHQVKGSLNPSWVGQTLERRYCLDGDSLTLIAKQLGGRSELNAQLDWRRIP